MRALFKLACLFVILSLSLTAVQASAGQILGNRSVKLTLIPDYVNHTIHFDGWIDFHDPLRSLDLDGLPFVVERQWRAKGSSTWNLSGSIQAGKTVYDKETKSYHLVFGPVRLQPDDRLSLVLPFVNLDYTQIQPPADEPDEVDGLSRQLTHMFTYSAGDAGREIPSLDIPFTPVTMKANLVLTPLVGRALVGKANALQLDGKVQFEGIRDFNEFSRYCQIASERIQHGDYRAGHLLYELDFPAYFGPDVLNPIYAVKPTRLALRTDLTACQYDREKSSGQVDATVMGQALDVLVAAKLWPPELRGSNFADGNYSFSPKPGFKGVQGSQILLGRIFLAPGDLLTITIPNTQIQVDGLQPDPGAYQDSGGQRIVFTGPASFELSVPYVAQTELYASQFPSILRPGFSLIEDQLGSFYPLAGSRATWLLLALGLFLYALSLSVPALRRLSPAAWLLVAVSLFYGVRGAFGLLCVAVLFHITRARIAGAVVSGPPAMPGKIARGLAGFALIALGVNLDSKWAEIFRGLSAHELSPLTPLILMVLTFGLLLLLYGGPAKPRLFTYSDLPVLLLFLAVLSLYDAFGKSLLSLLIFLAGGWYIVRATAAGQRASLPGNEHKLEDDLYTRWRLAFGNRVIPVAILVLIGFVMFNDLTATYANDLQILLPPLIAPLAIPLMDLASVSITLVSLAILFVLVYPFLPFQNGYLKAVLFTAFLFVVFLFGVGTDTGLMLSLPNILLGRLVYYLSVPMLIGLYFDIHGFMETENQRRAREGKGEEAIGYRAAVSMFLNNLQGWLGTLAGILAVLAPSLYALLSNQTAVTSYFSLLQQLVLLPIA